MREDTTFYEVTNINLSFHFSSMKIENIIQEVIFLWLLLHFTIATIIIIIIIIIIMIIIIMIIIIIKIFIREA